MSSYTILLNREDEKRERRRIWFWRLAVLFFLLLFGGVVNIGLHRHEKLECYEWRQAPYLERWQADQCENNGVPMTGIPVRE